MAIAQNDVLYKDKHVLFLALETCSQCSVPPAYNCQQKGVL